MKILELPRSQNDCFSFFLHIIVVYSLFMAIYYLCVYDELGIIETRYRTVALSHDESKIKKV